MIEGVSLIPLICRADDRGYLIEVVRKTETGEAYSVCHKFGQVYLVGNFSKGTVRAFHKHKQLWDWFFISHGSAKFILVDDREKSHSYKEMGSFVLCSRNPSLLVVPPGVYHGWMSLEDDSQMISIASEVYNQNKPDEERIPPDSFGDVWSIKGR